ncbi:MAG TPA: Flp family type IVb pilin [Peptococcaceae bacterium]|nr:MAG: Flp/Fap pilin component [Clostridia bacterium 41_269]HBT20212.1 Flp family type IVb pilin [Peptococcaceae bacterium]
MLNILKRLWVEEEGQGLSEYGLILALVAIAVVAVLGLLGGNLSNIFDQIASKLNIGG